MGIFARIGSALERGLMRPRPSQEPRPPATKGALSRVIGNGGPFRIVEETLPILTPTFITAIETLSSKMIDIPGMPGRRIMKDELLTGLFQWVMVGYKPEGYNASELRRTLANPSQARDALVVVSYNDAVEFVERLNILSGRRFRVQTNAEWEQARDQLSGENWTWTATTNEKGQNVIRRLINPVPHLGNTSNFDHAYSAPGIRNLNIALRLVEDS